MSTPLTRLLKAIHTVPLTIARPILFWWAAHKRRSGAWRVRPPTREALETRPEPAIRSLQASIETVGVMRAELGRVLDGDESHRQTYRHLARFERKFDKYGLRTIEQLPVDQLRRALREFEALVRNWSSASLADLRSRMAVVLADRASASSVWIAVNTVNGAHRHGPGIAMRLPAGTGGAAARAATQRGGRHLGMSRFNWADGGFNSTSAPA
ncbi:MAG: hypothetical protein ABIQ06_12155 [Caldimonas sp.]